MAEMSFKKPLKIWQGILLSFLLVFVAISGVLIYVYLTTGFGNKTVYPQDISFENNISENFNELSGMLEADEDFYLTVNTETEMVSKSKIKLSFSKSFSEVPDEDGFITDGNVKVLQEVLIGDEFLVKLVKQDGNNIGGESQIFAKTENNIILPTSIKIDVDVKVQNIENAFSYVGRDDEIIGSIIDNVSYYNIINGTSIVMDTNFFPASSEFMFRNDDEEEFEKLRVFEFVEGGNNFESVIGLEDTFVIDNEINATTTIMTYAFATAKAQKSYLKDLDTNISGDDFENLVLTYLKKNKDHPNIVTSCKSIVKFVEPTVASFNVSIEQMDIAVNSLKTATVNDFGISVLNDLGNEENAIYNNLALKVKKESILDSGVFDLIAFDEVMVNKNLEQIAKCVKSHDEKAGVFVESTYDEAEYILIDNNVYNKNDCFWTFSNLNEGNYIFEFVLFKTCDDGLEIFGEMQDGFFVESKFEVDVGFKDQVESNISWIDVDNLDLEIQDTNVYLPSNLEQFINIPQENIYKEIKFFAYNFKNKDGEIIADEEITNFISGNKIEHDAFAGVEGFVLEIDLDVEIKDEITFDMFFVTIKTDAYGNEILVDGDNVFVKTSDDLTVGVSKSVNFPTDESFIIIVDEELKFTDSEGVVHNVVPYGNKDGVTFEIVFTDDIQANRLLEQIENVDVFVKIDSEDNHVLIKDYNAQIKAIDKSNVVKFSLSFKDNNIDVNEEHSVKIVFKYVSPSKQKVVEYVFDEAITIYNNKGVDVKWGGDKDLANNAEIVNETGGKRVAFDAGVTYSLEEFNQTVKDTIVVDKYGKVVTTVGNVIFEEDSTGKIEINNNIFAFPGIEGTAFASAIAVHGVEVCWRDTVTNLEYVGPVKFEDIFNIVVGFENEISTGDTVKLKDDKNVVLSLNLKREINAATNLIIKSINDELLTLWFEDSSSGLKFEGIVRKNDTTFANETVGESINLSTGKVATFEIVKTHTIDSSATIEIFDYNPTHKRVVWKNVEGVSFDAIVGNEIINTDTNKLQDGERVELNLIVNKNFESADGIGFVVKSLNSTRLDSMNFTFNKTQITKVEYASDIKNDKKGTEEDLETGEDLIEIDLEKLGYKGNQITFSNLISLYYGETGTTKIEDDKLYYNIDSSNLNSFDKNEMFCLNDVDGMLKVSADATLDVIDNFSSLTKITRFNINYDFAEDQTFVILVGSDNIGIQFKINLTILSNIQGVYKNNFDDVDYDDSVNVINANSNGVYAEFEINLNEALVVNRKFVKTGGSVENVEGLDYSDENKNNVNWSTEIAGDGYSVFNTGKIVFDEVFEKTEVETKIYQIDNQYAYSFVNTFDVYPNFKINIKQENLSIIKIKSGEEAVADFVEVERYVGDLDFDSSFDLDYKINDLQNNEEDYLAVNIAGKFVYNGNFNLTDELVKEYIIKFVIKDKVLKDFDNYDIKAQLSLSSGLTNEDIAGIIENACVVKWQGEDIVYVKEGIHSYSTLLGNFANFEFGFENINTEVISITEGKIVISSNNDLIRKENLKLRIRFVSDSTTIQVATINYPILISAFGADLPKYDNLDNSLIEIIGTGNEDLIIQAVNENNYIVKYVFEGKNYFGTINKSKTNNNSASVYTSVKLNNNAKLVAYDEEMQDISILLDDENVLKENDLAQALMAGSEYEIIDDEYGFNTADLTINEIIIEKNIIDDNGNKVASITEENKLKLNNFASNQAGFVVIKMTISRNGFLLNQYFRVKVMPNYDKPVANYENDLSTAEFLDINLNSSKTVDMSSKFFVNKKDAIELFGDETQVLVVEKTDEENLFVKYNNGLDDYFGYVERNCVVSILNFNGVVVEAVDGSVTTIYNLEIVEICEKVEDEFKIKYIKEQKEYFANVNANYVDTYLKENCKADLWKDLGTDDTLTVNFEFEVFEFNNESYNKIDDYSNKLGINGNDKQITFTAKNSNHYKVVLTNKYSNVVFGSVEYVFYINSSIYDYELTFASDDLTVNNNQVEVLPKKEESQGLTIITKRGVNNAFTNISDFKETRTIVKASLDNVNFVNAKIDQQNIGGYDYQTLTFYLKKDGENFVLAADNNTDALATIIYEYATSKFEIIVHKNILQEIDVYFDFEIETSANNGAVWSNTGKGVVSSLHVKLQPSVIITESVEDFFGGTIKENADLVNEVNDFDGNEISDFDVKVVGVEYTDLENIVVWNASAAPVTFAMLYKDQTVVFTINLVVNSGDFAGTYVYKIQKTIKANASYNDGSMLTESEELVSAIDLGKVVAGKTVEKALGEYLKLEDETDEYGSFEIEAINSGTILADSNGFIIDNDGKITLTTTNVSQEIAQTLIFKVIYKLNDKFSFSFVIKFILAVEPNVRLSVNYPQTSSESDYQFESIQVVGDKEINLISFLQGNSHPLANGNRVVIDGVDGAELDLSETEFTIKSAINVEFEILEKDLTIRLEDGCSSGEVVITMTLNTVSIDYVLKVSSNNVYFVLQNLPNVNNEDVEQIYADSMTEYNILGKNRILKITTNSNNTDLNNETLVFTFADDSVFEFVYKSSSHGNRTFCVDVGRAVAGVKFVNIKNQDQNLADRFEIEITQRLTLGYLVENGEYQEVENKDYTGVIDDSDFQDYSIADKTSNTDIEVKFSFEIDETGILTGQTYKYCLALDIAVENALVLDGDDELDTSSYITITAKDGIERNIVDIAGIYKPSLSVGGSKTYLTADNCNNVSIDISVCADKDDAYLAAFNARHADEFDNINYATTNNSVKYLTYTPIKNEENKIWNFGIIGEGAENKGSWVLVKIDYEMAITKTFYVMFRILPNVEFVANNMLRTSTVRNDGEFVESVSSNRNNIYEVPKITKDNALQYNFNVIGTDGVVKIYKQTDDSVELQDKLDPNDPTKDAWTYSFAENDGSESDFVCNQTLADVVSGVGNGWAVDADKYTYSHKSNSSNSLTITNSNIIVFGEKNFKLNIFDKYGYNIDFYFKFTPLTPQNPARDESSITTITEGDKFDIGAVYEKITATNSSEIGYIYDENNQQIGFFNQEKTQMTLNDVVYNVNEDKTLATNSENNADTFAITKTDGEITAVGDKTVSYYNFNKTSVVPDSSFNISGINAWGFAEASHNYQGQGIDERYFDPNQMALQYLNIANITFEKDGFEVGGIKGVNVKPATEGGLNLPKKNNTDWYRDVNDDKFTMPTLDSWVYNENVNTNESKKTETAEIDMVVELTFVKDGITVETNVVFPVTVTRNLEVDKSKEATVADGTPFNVEDNLIKIEDEYKLLDDTLTITLPKKIGNNNSKVSIIVRVNNDSDGSYDASFTTTVENSNYNYSKTERLFMSDLLRDINNNPYMLKSTDKLKFEFSGDGFVAYYGGRSLIDDSECNVLNLNKSDSINITNSNEFVEDENGNWFAQVVKSYIVESGEEAYRVEKRYNVTPCVFKTDLFKTIADSNWISVESEEDKIEPESWLSSLNYYLGTGVNQVVAQQTSIGNLNDILDKLTLKIIVESGESPATVDENKNIEINENYASNDYIPVYIYAKAAGAKGDFANESEDDVLIGVIRIIAN